MPDQKSTLKILTLEVLSRYGYRGLLYRKLLYERNLRWGAACHSPSAWIRATLMVVLKGVLRPLQLFFTYGYRSINHPLSKFCIFIRLFQVLEKFSSIDKLCSKTFEVGSLHLNINNPDVQLICIPA